MRQSELFTKTIKQSPQDEPSSNAQLLIRGGFIQKVMAGVYSILPLGLQVMRQIEAVVRDAMTSSGAQEVYLPALQPKALWDATGRWETMDEILYKIKDRTNHEYTLGPTHEEIVVPLMQHFIQSYKDLPRVVFQFQTKYRMELRPKSGILRGREFLMKDCYSFHSTAADLDRYYDTMKQAYHNIFEQLGLGDVTYFTFASGGAFTKYSHEFQTVTAAGEDIIYICSQCRQAINREIKADTPTCPNCQGGDFTEAKAIEVGNIFKLQDRFTEPFHVQVTNEAGERIPVLMGCYGIGLTRLLGTIVEVHHDDQGIIWPKRLAPFQVHLLNLQKDPTLADSLYHTLQQAGFSVLYDDRLVSPGNKLADSDLIGLPYRIVTGSKTGQDQVEIKQRCAAKTVLVPLDQMIAFLKQ